MKIRQSWTLTAGVTRRRGPPPTGADPSGQRIALLERQLVRATARAERLELIVELQKKVAQLLGLALPVSDDSSETP